MGKTAKTAKAAKKPTYAEIVDATSALRNSAYGRILLDFVDLAWAVVEEIDVRAMLRYLVRRGKLERDGQGDAALYCVPVPTGLADVVSRKIEKSREPWQGRWHVFSYDIPTASNTLRHRLVRHLHPMGFASLGRSVWISPYDWRDELRGIVAGRPARCCYMECTTVGPLEHSTETDELDLWELSDLPRCYGNLIRRCTTAPQGRSMSARRARAHALLAAHKQLAELDRLDPMLPLRLLPKDWPRARAEQALEALRTHVEEDLRTRTRT